MIALCGVLVPLAGGFALAHFFNKPGMIASDANGTIFLQNIFIGIVLTATSVSITVETLKELGKLKTRSGNAILGAAIIDDILGIIALTIVTSLADSSVSIVAVLLKIVGFFVFAGVVGFLFYMAYKKWTEAAPKNLHRHVIIAFVFCLLMAYIAEAFHVRGDQIRYTVVSSAFSGILCKYWAESRTAENVRYDCIVFRTADRCGSADEDCRMRAWRKTL